MRAKLGIVAGGGDLPARLIAHCEESGRPYFVLAMEEQTDPALVAGSVPHAWTRLGALGTAFRLLRDAGGRGSGHGRGDEAPVDGPRCVPTSRQWPFWPEPAP